MYYSAIGLLAIIVLLEPGYSSEPRQCLSGAAVLDRADNSMYENKKLLKAVREE